MLVTTESLYRRKVAAMRDDLPHLRHVVLVGPSGAAEGPGLIGFDEAVARQPGEYDVARTEPSDPALLHFTSGTTGQPKGAVHVHEAVGRSGSAPSSPSTCIPATSSGAPPTPAGSPARRTASSHRWSGATVVSFAGEFEAQVWYRILAEQRVTVWYTGADGAADADALRHGPPAATTSALRHVASVGEALNPRWSRGAWRCWPAHPRQLVADRDRLDHDQQLPPHADPAPADGPAGPGRRRRGARPRRGRRARVQDGVPPAAVGQTGELALRRLAVDVPHLPRRRGALPRVPPTAGTSGDLAALDEDGYVWFVGRADDVIKSAGHLIGPVRGRVGADGAPEVVEAGVIGMPDELAGEVVRAYVRCGPQHRRTTTCAATWSPPPGAAWAASRPGHRSTSTCPTTAAEGDAPGPQGPRAGPARR